METAQRDARPFSLRVERHKNNEVRWVLLQRSVRESAGNGDVPLERVVALWGLPLEVAREVVVDALRHHRQPPSFLSRPRTEALSLDEATGARLGVLFKALKPLRKRERMEDVREGIERMSDEEACYWFAKVMKAGSARRAERALRILLSEEG